MASILTEPSFTNVPNTISNGNINHVKKAGVNGKSGEGKSILQHLDNAKASYLLPEKALFGPVTKSKAYRVLAIFVSMQVLGNAIWFSSAFSAYRLLGAGILFPGAGFLALGGWWMLLFPIFIALFPLAVFLWWLVGNLLLPPLVYLGSAALAARIGRRLDPTSLVSVTPYITSVLVLLILGWWFNGIREMGIEMEETRLHRNTYIDAQVALENGSTQAATNSFRQGERELSPKHIASMRYLMNLTRQPLSSWKGFTHIEQFRESALRYQLFYITYGLSMIQCNITPNFHGELSRAQRSAIEKVLTPSVLYYWVWESLWGRFSFKWDPVEKENIMVTGWYLLALMMYTGTTRDKRYMEPESLVFRVTSWLKYPHSIPTIVKSLMTNWNESEFCLYACEPNWVYSICNLFGMTGSIIYDRLNGTENLKKILPRFTKAWDDEFMNRDGLVVPVRSSLVGLQLPVGGMSVYAGTSFQCGPLLGKISDQLWAIAKNEFCVRDKDGKLMDLKLSGTDFVDPGSFAYSAEGIAAKSWIMLSATERGDTELAEYLEKSIRSATETVSDGCGGTYIDGLSTFSNAAFAAGIFGGPEDFRNTVDAGPPEHIFEGPLLAEAPYPQVVVAKAWSHDGKNLDIVLYPGQEGVVERVTLSLERLKSRGKYVVKQDGEEKNIEGDIDGNATVEVIVEGRTPIHVSPFF